MLRLVRLTLLGLIVLAAALYLNVVTPAHAQSFTDAQRAEIEKIVKDYLLKNPEILIEMSSELEKRQAAVEGERRRELVKANADALFRSPRDAVIGNPNGDVTFVEYFDYNCGFCKRAFSDLQELIKTDPKLRVVLKEFPVLGESSVEAAQVAVALKQQDASGKKYFDFHQKMMTNRGRADKARALAVAKEVGADMARLEKDMAGAEVRSTLQETFAVAEKLGLNGTPAYIVGNEVAVGAVGLDALKTKINLARCGKDRC